MLVFEDTTMCTLPVWGRVDLSAGDDYGDLATDCDPVDEVRLEALPAPGSALEIDPGEWVGEGGSSGSAWRTLDGELLCR